MAARANRAATSAMRVVPWTMTFLFRANRIRKMTMPTK
jgi:hypothetical protein